MAELHLGSQMSKRGLRTEKRDLERTFQPERPGHDLTVNGAERGIRHRAGIDGLQFLQQRLFALRDIERLSAFPFPFPNFLDNLVTIVQQLNDLPVDRVDPHSQILKIHIRLSLLKYSEFKIYCISALNSSIGLDFFTL